MNYINNNMSGNGLLLEYNCPDHVDFEIDDTRTHILRFRDFGAIGFFLTNDKVFYCDNSLTHMEMKADYCAKHFGFDSNDEYNAYVENPENDSTRIEAMEEEYEAIYAEITSRGSSCIEGRFWQDYNVFAFWHEIPDFADFELILKGISEFTNQNLSFEDVKIALENDILPCSEVYDECIVVKNLDRENSEKEKAIHLMNAEEKVETQQMKDYLQKRSENVGKKLKYSNANKEMPMAQWRALHNTSENKKYIQQENKMNLLENYIKNMVIESINEVGKSKRGQWMLGRLGARQAKRGETTTASDKAYAMNNNDYSEEYEKGWDDQEQYGGKPNGQYFLKTNYDILKMKDTDNLKRDFITFIEKQGLETVYDCESGNMGGGTPCSPLPTLVRQFEDAIGYDLTVQSKNELKKAYNNWWYYAQNEILGNEDMNESFIRESNDMLPDPNYTHFAINKTTGKIVNGWDYRDVDPEDLKYDKKYYFMDDLRDCDLNPKDYKILTKKYVIRMGIDINDWNNWANS